MRKFFEIFVFEQAKGYGLPFTENLQNLLPLLLSKFNCVFFLLTLFGLVVMSAFPAFDVCVCVCWRERKREREKERERKRKRERERGRERER